MKLLLAAALLSAASFAAFAAEPKAPVTPQGENAADARSVASDQEVGQARRYYRSQCNRYESAPFCDCVTAGVAQALAPGDLRLAGRTIRERITAQGDAANSSNADPPIADGDQAGAMARIEQAEGHYVDACSSFRK